MGDCYNSQEQLTLNYIWFVKIDVSDHLQKTCKKNTLFTEPYFTYN